MYIMTAKRMISGLVLKYRKAEHSVVKGAYVGTLPASSQFLLTMP